MSDGLWMPLYVGDYLRDTGHLSTLEHGAYFLLLLHAWSHEGILPACDSRVRKIARLDARDWKRCREHVMRFFYVAPEGLRHKRVDEELGHSRARQERASQAGKASAAQRALQRKFNASSTAVATRVDSKLKPSTNLEATNTTHTTESKHLLNSQLPRIRVAKSMPTRTFVGLEEHVTTEHDTGRRFVRGEDLDIAFGRICDAAQINTAAWAGNERPVIQWLADGYEPDPILEAVKRVVARPGYQPPSTLAYFDKPIRQQQPTSEYQPPSLRA